MTRRAPRARRALGSVALVLVLAGCSEVSVSSATPIPAPTQGLPPIGFSHRYGNNPMASHDGTQLERRFYAIREFWETELLTQPVAAGYVDVGSATAAAVARSAVTSMTVVLATEERGTIAGLLATGSDTAQESYVESVLAVIRALGYDHLQSVDVQVFFSEHDKHADLMFAGGRYTYTVHDGDVPPANLHVVTGGTPLPAPT